MRKKIIVIVAIIGIISLSSSFAESKKNDNPVHSPSELVKSALKSFALAPEGAAKETKTDISGHVSVFQRFLLTDESDLPLNVSGLSGGRAAEFSTVGSSAGAGFGLKGFLGDNSLFNLSGKSYHKDEQAYYAGLDIGRIVRTEFQSSRFIHRLDHDPLTNVDPDPEAQHEFPFVDSNPDDVYSTTRTEIINKTDLVIPSIPNLKIKSQVRYVHENGSQQARTFEMCTVCHIEAQTQAIDQRTRDFIIGAEFKTKGVALSYSHLGRSFENKANPLYHEYTNPYGSFPFEGTQEFAHIPDSEKNADTLKAKVDAVKNASLFGSYTIAKVKNKNNNGEADIKNFLSRFRALLGKGFNLTLRYGNNKYENNLDPDYAFDTSTLVANHLSTDGYAIGADASYRIPKQKIHLRAGLDYNSLKRNFSWASEVEEEEKDLMDKYLEEMKTTTYRVGVTFYPSPKIKGFLRYKGKSIENPLGVPHSAEENPVDPTTERFMTSLYTDIHLVSAGVSVIPANRFALTANYFYNSGKNDQIDSSQKRHNIVFSLWYALTNKVSITAAYTYLNEKIVNSLIYGTQYEYQGQRIAREDKDVPYNKNVNVFLVALDYRLSDNFSIFGDFSMTIGKSDWVSTGIEGIEEDTSGLADLSDQDIAHYRISAGADYFLMKNVSVFGKWKYEDYKDKAFVIHATGGYEDSGHYHILYFGFGYRF
ncbi:MAG: outer membrane beta-barrel protein [Candidatus Aminicenantes bacterium]|nr:outer membrane beta-barrel protein [Candidatus Aminicenantes bacterium]